MKYWNCRSVEKSSKGSSLLETVNYKKLLCYMRMMNTIYLMQLPLHIQLNVEYPFVDVKSQVQAFTSTLVK